MRIQNIRATNMELTPAIEDYVNKRVSMLEKVVDKSDTSASANVEVGKTSKHHKEGNFFFTEINLHIAGKDFRVVSEKDDLYASVDEAKDELMGEVTHYKDKQRTLIRRGGAAIKNLIRGMGDFGGRIRNKMNPFKRFRK